MVVKQVIEDRWTTSEERHAIGEKHSKEFRSEIEAVALVQEHPFVKSFVFIKGEDLLRLDRLPRFQDVRDRLTPVSEKGRRYFISHRWLSVGHPDPSGRQLRLLQRFVDPESSYWIDYCCLPQPPMTQRESELFRESLTHLPSLLYELEVIALRHRGDDYFGRAWCFLETLAGTVICEGLTQEFEDPTETSTLVSEERRVVEQTLLANSLPSDLLVTNEADLQPIRMMTETIGTFFELNVVMHYLSLGQTLSEQHFFFGEHPYYHLAVCDFSQVILWVCDKAREYDLPLSDIGNNEHTDNFFQRLAGKERFVHAVNPHTLPKKVTMDQSKVAWLMIRRDSARDPELESAHNLFYILTSLIK